jgi:hypothetical protein
MVFSAQTMPPFATEHQQNADDRGAAPLTVPGAVTRTVAEPERDGKQDPPGDQEAEPGS